MTNVEQLAKQLVEAEAEAARTAADADANLLAANLQDRLRELDGREALGELTAKDAARARGNLQAEADARVDAAKRARRAADYVQDRLVEAAEAAAAALRSKPLAGYEAAAEQRDAAAAILAEREQAVAEAEAKLAAADAEAEDLRVKYVPAAAAARADRENRRKSQIQWAIRQQNPLALGMIDEPFREEAREQMEKLAAESRARRAEYEEARGWARLEPA